jgi:hypothetical protein
VGVLAAFPWLLPPYPGLMNTLPNDPRFISAKAANKCKRNLGIGLSAPVSIDSVGLRNRMPTDTSSDGADAMRHATAPAVQLPDKHSFELTQPGFAQELVQARAAEGGPTETRIYILCKDLEPALGDILAQFVKLHLATLVGADSGVYGDDHGL